jgi:D-alanine transfer protein
VSKNLPHLGAGLLAILLLAGVIAGGSLYAHVVELRYVNALAPLLLQQVNLGSAVQQAAFEQPDLLPAYGSSELLLGSSSYRASQYFSAYPTGFTVFEIAKSGVTSLMVAQDLAAVGRELNGKKVVISFTPSMFNNREIGPGAYAADFSRLHAYALIFSPDLSFEVRHQAALRMLEYRDTYRKDPLLKFALENLSGGSRRKWLLYELAVPLGRLETWIIRLQDHWEVLNYIWAHPEIKPAVHRQPAVIDWQAEMAKAEFEQAAATSANPYGIEKLAWQKILKGNLLSKPVVPGSGDALFLRNLNRTREWSDLEILLEILKEYGARPVIISRPLNGPILEATGVSWDARQVYYKRLNKIVKAYGFPLVDFMEHDGDKYFSTDLFSHTSRKGWVYVNQTLDAYYHGHLR